MDYTKIRPDKPGRWWVKFKDCSITQVYIASYVNDVLCVFAEQSLGYGEYTSNLFPIKENDRDKFHDYTWETMEMKENGNIIEYCAPLFEKPPWNE